MDKIEKIKAEIELRIAQWSQYTFACASQVASEAIDRIDELKGLLAFIDSLQDEPKKLRAGKGSYKWLEEQQQFEDIKAELSKLLTECEVDPEAEYVYRSMLLLVARHFAEWQKGKDSKISEELGQNFTKSADVEEAARRYSVRHTDSQLPIEELFDVPYDVFAESAFKAGAAWQKEQLMNEAVEADVNTYEEQPSGMSYVELVVDIPASRMKKKEKARIIILEDDEEG